MEPSQYNDGDGSHGQFSGGNMNAYQPGWNPPYMYGQFPSGNMNAYQPRGWFPQSFQPYPPNVAMMNQSGYPSEGFQQVEIPGATVQNSEADLQQVPVSTGKTRNKKSGIRQKLGNFNPEEDKNLVKSWLEISCDPITSTGQKRDRLWERIMKRYNSRRASNPERSLRSLQSRWDTIRAEVTLFASYYADAIRENPSGMSDADKTTHAVGNFAGVLHRKFGYLHCWELMKDEPKWQDPNARAARGEGFGEQSNAANDLEDGQSTPVQSGSHATRPMGRDSAKAAKKKGNADAASTSSAEHAAKMRDISLQRISMMQEESVSRNDRFQQLASNNAKFFEEMQRNNEAMLRHNEATLKMEQEKFQFMREQAEKEQKEKEEKNEERILGMDLHACPENLRIYYETKQQQILAKQAASRRGWEQP